MNSFAFILHLIIFLFARFGIVLSESKRLARLVNDLLNVSRIDSGKLRIEKSEFDPQIFNVFGLHHQGELVTDRVVMHKDSTCEMVLDRNVYLGQTDFELEVEYSKESERRAQTLIENIGECLVASEQLTGIDEFVARVGQGKYKSQRFFDRFKDKK